MIDKKRMDGGVKKWQWLVALIICAIVYLGQNSSNEAVQQTISRVVYSSEDISFMRSTIKELFLEESKIEVAAPVYGTEMLKFVTISRYDEGYLLEFEEGQTLRALNNGIIVYTGHTATTGKVLSVLYDNSCTVTYGYLDHFTNLPYSTISKGDALATKEAGSLYIQIECDGKILNLEETIEWLKQYG